MSKSKCNFALKIDNHTMAIVIYAIIRESETSTLRKICEYTNSSRCISDAELCRFHNYAIDLYSAYCSCLPRVQCNNISFYSERHEAVEFEDAIKRLKEKYQDRLIAYSHRFGGWTAFEWKFNEDIKFVISTNFGYGSNSYFEQTIYYKGIKLAPYSKLVRYRYADFNSITSHTYEYHFEYSEWDNLMNDSLAFYNAIVHEQESYIFRWLSYHLEKMTNELEQYITTSSTYFDNIIKETNYGSTYYRTSSILVEGDDFWVAKSRKISEALLFLENIKQLPVQVNPSKYIDRIHRINKMFLPKLLAKINLLKTAIHELENQVIDISSRMPLSLYIRLYNKYYYTKQWYLSYNRFSMLMFLMKMLRRKSNISIHEIRTTLPILDRQISTWEELKDKLYKNKSVLHELEKDKEKIIAYFDSMDKNSENTPND